MNFGRLREASGQAAIPVVAGAVVLFAGVSLFAQYGGALAARGRDQRSADLAAVAAARRMERPIPVT